MVHQSRAVHVPQRHAARRLRLRHTGDFGPAFLTALDIKTGQAAWQHRGFGRASLLHADGKTIIMDEDGDLALARLTPEGVTILSQAKIFDTTSWTVPTLVGTPLYARDREKIVALELGLPASERAVSTTSQADSRPIAQRSRASRQPAALAVSERTRVEGPAVSERMRVEGPAVSERTRVERPRFGGTWRLDAAASRINPAAGLAGLIAAGAPPMLFITEPANGDLMVESQINEGHARMYRPGGKTQTPAGQAGTITIDDRPGRSNGGERRRSRERWRPDHARERNVHDEPGWQRAVDQRDHRRCGNEDQRPALHAIDRRRPV